MPKWFEYCVGRQNDVIRTTSVLAKTAEIPLEIKIRFKRWLPLRKCVVTRNVGVRVWIQYNIFYRIQYCRYWHNRANVFFSFRNSYVLVKTRCLLSKKKKKQRLINTNTLFRLISKHTYNKKYIRYAWLQIITLRTLKRYACTMFKVIINNTSSGK